MILFLFIACATKTIQGSVLSYQDLPLANATVTLASPHQENSLTQSTQTNENGVYRFDGLRLEKGSYEIVITHEAHQFSKDSYLISGSLVELPAIQLEELNISIPYPQIPLDSALEAK